MTESIKEMWLNDIPCQFRDSPNINGIITAFSKQLDELEAVFNDLIYKVDLDTAEGRNLDMLGDIVNIKRQEAYELVEMTNAEVLDDTVYRNVLRFKALKNNSPGTYSDIMKGLYLLWGDLGADISYVENDVEPAQISIDVADIPSDAMDPTMIRPMVIKPGGVKIYFTSSFRDTIEIEDWEQFRLVSITSENNHYWNGVWKWNGAIQWQGDSVEGQRFHSWDGKNKWNGNITWGPIDGEEEFDMDAVLLNQAKKKMLRLRATGEEGWKITHFVFGTGLVNGKPYTPSPDQSDLLNEVARTEVVSRQEVGIDGTTYRYTGAIGTNECGGMYITEVGLVDSDGMLVCVKTFDKKMKQNGTEMVFKIDDVISLG